MTHSDGVDRRTALKHLGLAAVTTAFMQHLEVSADDDLRALQNMRTSKDARLGDLKDLNGYFPFKPYSSREEWEKRADYVRRQMRVAAGLWPMPDVDPIHAVVHDPVEREDFIVNRVFFESTPGLYVTGSLFRPKNHEGKMPVILCPHGHWSNGRFFEHSEDAIKQELASGAEKYPVSGRYPLQARSAQLARMGCLVFHYDMLGYADSAPFTGETAHSLNKQRDAMKDPKHWGIFSAQADLRLINILGLQTFHSMRILDWITGLDNVDTERIGVTGASGGGTQTFMIAALDPRVTAAFPAVMVSTAMQGGCTCENATYLRVNTGNIEFAALCAPRPLGMSAANDWTAEIETKGLPELKQHYTMMGVPDRVEGKKFEFGHNYNYVSRAMMYEFFNKHFHLGAQSPIVEPDFKPLTREELTVWSDKHPKPVCDAEAEVNLMRSIDTRWQQQVNSLRPADETTWKKYRETIGGAIDIMVGRALPVAEDVEYESLTKADKGDYRLFVGLLRNKAHNEELPTAFVMPKDWKGDVVLWIDPAGKASMFKEDGSPRPEVESLLKAGVSVGSVDVLYTGEFLPTGEKMTEWRKVENPREIAAFTMGYNHPLFSQRVHDVMTLITFAKHHPSNPKRIHMVGLGNAAAWAAAACAQAGEVVDKLALSTDGFRFGTITEYRNANLWPGAVKYGDLPGVIGLCAPHPTWLAGEGPQPPDLVAACYQAAGAGQRITSYAGSKEQTLPELVRWLTVG